MIDILYNSPYNIRDTCYIVAKIISARWKIFLPLVLIEIIVIAIVTILCICIPLTIRDYYDYYYRRLLEDNHHDTFDENDYYVYPTGVLLHDGDIHIRSNDEYNEQDDTIRRLSINFVYYYQAFIYYMSRLGYFISIYRRLFETGATIIHSVFAGATVYITAQMYTTTDSSSSSTTITTSTALTSTPTPTPTLKESILTHGWKHKFKLIFSLIVQYLVPQLGIVLIFACIQLVTTLFGGDMMNDVNYIMLVFLMLLHGIIFTAINSYMICVIPSIVVEGKTIMDAFQQSWQRCQKKVFLIVFVFYIIIFIIMGVIGQIMFQMIPNMYIYAFGMDVLQLVHLHLFLIFSTVIYMGLRIQDENMTQTELSQELVVLSVPSLDFVAFPAQHPEEDSRGVELV